MPWFRNKLNASKRYFLKKTVRRRRAQSKLFQLSTTVAVLGEHSAGKTTVCRKLTQKMYPDGFERTTEYYDLDLTLISDGVLCKHELSVHDTPGSLRETFPHLYENVIRKSDTFILVFSLASSDGLSVIYRTLNDLKNIKGSSVPTVIIANKSDLESKAEEDIKKRYKLYKNASNLNLPICEMNITEASDLRLHWIPLLMDIENRHGIQRGRDPHIVIK